MKKRYILCHFVSNEVYFALILKEPELNKNEIPVPQLSDAVASGLLGHEAHGVVMAALGHFAHLGPLVRIGIVVQHVSK